MEYNFWDIEPKWQKYWDENKTFRTRDNLSGPKFYILDMFPYPSGSGLHVGHPEGYTATDIVSRYKRMKGFNVLHPMGWDAFGLPAEQYAIQTGTHPAMITRENCDTFRRQIKSLGLSYDWEREINTTDPEYFRWTQWIFCQLYNTWYDPDSKKGRPVSELEVPDAIREQGAESVRKYVQDRRLAYYADAQVWWCQSCRTVCANEEVLTDGSHEKCGNQVARRNLKQWLLRIPHYAERLLEGLDTLDWPEGVKEMQRNWIGKSKGAEVIFTVPEINETISVFTTRPDTLFGATYMVISPEHPMAAKLATDRYKSAVEAYIQASSLKSDLDRTELAREKTGVFTGSYAVNPVNEQLIPVWMADYVLMGYGTGAIMAVPAHDTRDFEFAVKFAIPVTCILDPVDAPDELRKNVLEGKACWTEDGVYINSSNSRKGIDINGLNKEKGIATITAWLEKYRLGRGTIQYKIRDWLFSRQRYWGEPFPVIHWEDGEITLDDNLPVMLPEMEKYEPGEGGESPLSNAHEWLSVTDATGRKGRRETNTMPQWAGSCWYYLRFTDPRNKERIFDPECEKYWMPVDLYIGGAEHAVLHLLYSRFWHKVLFDLGIVSTDEPFQKLFNQGMILAFACETAKGAKVAFDSYKKVEVKEERISTTATTTTIITTTTTTLPNEKPLITREEKEISTSELIESGNLPIETKTTYKHIETDEDLFRIVAKMSKSLKNVVNPDDVVRKYGADALRLYEMFMGPLDERKPWADDGVKGVFNFLNRVYRFFSDPGNITEGQEDPETEKALHQAIRKVTSDIENLKFNTAVSALMVFNNIALKKEKVTVETAELFVRILSPFAPHIAEELWSLIGHSQSLAYENWPEANEKLLQVNLFAYPISFNGKMRFQFELPLDLTVNEIEKAVLGYEKTARYTEGKTVRKIIVIPGKIINVVVS